ncbi:MAG: Bor/Iss family lipoprotein [Myxococcales bacterium]
MAVWLPEALKIAQRGPSAPCRIMVLAALLTLSACRHTIVLSAADSATDRHADYLLWSHHYLWGFVGRTNLDVRDYCPRSAATRVELYTDIPALLISLGTLGIYVPRRLSVTCSKVGST